MFSQLTLRLFKAVMLLTLVGVSTGVSFAVTTVQEKFKAMTNSDGTLVALGFDNDLYTSDDDAASFNLRLDTSTLFNGVDENFTAVEALTTTVIAVGVDGLVLRSDNAGTAWTEANSSTLFGSLQGLAARTDGANPNRWIAVGEDNGSGIILQSVDDGQNWSETQELPDLPLADAVWTGNRWLACGRDEFSYQGVVYASSDGMTWSASSTPSDAAPLLALASGGNGVAFAVGEQGQILRSTDDGLSFSEVATAYRGGGDFRTVIADNSGVFFVGGDEKQIIKIDGTNANTLVPAAATAAPVLDFVLINDEPAAIGSYLAPAIRTIPFVVSISTGGSLDYVLSVEQTLLGKTYYVETTDDLSANNWTIVPGTSLAGNGGNRVFDVPKDGLKRFWRVVEF